MKSFFHFFRPYLWAILAGLLLFCSFPPINQPICVWIALIPMFYLLWKPETTSKRPGLKRFSYGYAMGLLYFGGTLWWINEVSTIGYIMITLYLSIFTGLWSWMIGGPLKMIYINKRTLNPDQEQSLNHEKKIAYKDMMSAVRASLFAGTAWVAIEFIRSLGSLSFTWNFLGSAMPLQIAQSAEFIGMIGLSFIPVFTSGILWASVSRVVTMTMAHGKRTVQWDFLLAMSLIAILFVLGIFRQVSLVPRGKTIPLHVLLIQENVRQNDKWKPENRVPILNSYMQHTAERINGLYDEMLAESKKGPIPFKQIDWVIWPESAFPWPIYQLNNNESIPEQPVAQFIDNVWHPYAKENGPFTLISGVDEAHFDAKTERMTGIFNTMRVFSQTFDKYPTSYRKTHLVPFGEYIPFRDSLPFLEKIFAYSAGISMGTNFGKGNSTDPLLISSPGGMISVIPSICFEDTVPSLLRKFVATNHPQVIINVTNDGWFNESAAAEQHFQNARFRAIELRRPLIRAANTGVTAIIQEDGSTQSPDSPKPAELRDENGNPHIEGTLYRQLTLPEKPILTLYALYGDWFSIQCLILTLFGLLLPQLKRKKDYSPTV